jgi:hypothetical protein
VVPIDPATFRTKYGIPASIQIFGPYSGALSNGGESLTLSRPGTPVGGVAPYITEDHVDYNDAAPWPTTPDGTGPSLERISTTVYGNDPIDWTAGPPLGTAVAPSIVSTQVGDGSVQRSTVKSFSVTFSTPVNFSSSSFTLYLATLNPDGTVAGYTNDVSAGVVAASTNGLTWTLTSVAGGLLDRNGLTGVGDLIDGVYRLVLHGPSVVDAATGIASLGTGDQIASFANNESNNAGTGKAQAFHVLYGDLAGTASVTNGDLNKLKQAFAPLGGIYNAALDFDNNGAVNNGDLNAFKKRFLESFSY